MQTDAIKCIYMYSFHFPFYPQKYAECMKSHICAWWYAWGPLIMCTHSYRHGVHLLYVHILTGMGSTYYMYTFLQAWGPLIMCTHSYRHGGPLIICTHSYRHGVHLLNDRHGVHLLYVHILTGMGFTYYMYTFLQAWGSLIICTHSYRHGVHLLNDVTFLQARGTLIICTHSYRRGIHLLYVHILTGMGSTYYMYTFLQAWGPLIK